jgi:cobalamin biosynthesis Mg chelatase CobN
MDAPDGVNGRPRGDHDEAPADDFDADSMLSSPADIESAGRSCMAILVLAAVIFLLLCIWIGFRSTGAGQ